MIRLALGSLHTRLIFLVLVGILSALGFTLISGLEQQRMAADADTIVARQLIALAFVAILALAAAWFGSDWFVLRRVQALVPAALQQREVEWERAQDAQRASEAKFHELFNHLGDAAFLCQAAEGEKPMRLIEVNDAACRLFGWAREELLGLTCQDIAAPEQANELREIFRFASAHGDIIFPTRLASKSGARIPVEISAHFFTSQGTRVILCVARDIAERRRAEDDLRESAERFRSVAQTANDAVISIDQPGHIIFWNRAAEKIFGYSAQEMMGKELHLIMPERYRQAHQSGIGRVAAQGEPKLVGKTVELAGLRKDGSEFPIELSLATWQTNDGVFFTGILRDITERKRAEHAIIQARDFYLTLFEDFPALVWRSGLDAKCDYFNKTWLAFTGRTLEQELGEGGAEGVHPEDFDRRLQTYLEAFRARRAFEMEYRLRRYDGEYRWVLDMGRPFNDLDGNFAGYIGSCYDITERKQIDEQLRYISTHDALTGLYNRMYFEEELERLGRSRHFPVSLVMVDMDGLKIVNDLHGHAAGDELLRRAAQVLRLAFRAEDVVARIGGDEFVVLLPNTDAAAVSEALVRTRRVLMVHNALQNGSSVSLSLGAATAQSGDGLGVALREADAQMYQDKFERRGTGV